MFLNCWSFAAFVSQQIIAKQTFFFYIIDWTACVFQGSENVTTYTFNTHTAKHMFCKICGVQSFYTPRSNPDGFGRWHSTTTHTHRQRDREALRPLGSNHENKTWASNHEYEYTTCNWKIRNRKMTLEMASVNVQQIETRILIPLVFDYVEWLLWYKL